MEKVQFRDSGRKWRFEAPFPPFCKMLNGGEFHLEGFSAHAIKVKNRLFSPDSDVICLSAVCARCGTVRVHLAGASSVHFPSAVTETAASNRIGKSTAPTLRTMHPLARTPQSSKAAKGGLPSIAG